MLSIRSFVRRAPIDLLVRFLDAFEIVVELEPDDKLRSRLDKVDTALASAARGTRGAVEQAIDRIDKLATEPGEAAIEAVAHRPELESQPSALARSTWLYLHDRDMFRRAEDIHYSDNQRFGRQWTAFLTKPDCALLNDDEHLKSLEGKLKEWFDSRHVMLEIFTRIRPGDGSDDAGEEAAVVSQITIYREGRAAEDLAFKDDALTVGLKYPVLEASMTYDAKTGRVECVAPDKDQRHEIVRLMAQGLLGVDGDHEPVEQRAYDLKPLAKRIVFDTDPDDPIEQVWVSMMRLQPVETSSERVIVTSLRGSGRDIWDQVAVRLGAKALASDYTITQAHIQVRHRPDGAGRLRTLNVIITHPHNSSLRECTEIERLLASKYLARWGLLVQ
ncbi:MAG: hypothetical protein KDK08_26685 [Rhizobiaceae bacterium]|nr:hypothetical protein [Rhizobiaceae bacterium]